jgi:hypothetical protein
LDEVGRWFEIVVRRCREPVAAVLTSVVPDIRSRILCRRALALVSSVAGGAAKVALSLLLAPGIRATGRRVPGDMAAIPSLRVLVARSLSVFGQFASNRET